tara:strand:- start:847 stop:1023 length:177 start_codon:yes stop_codon:yes gene_type:complete
MKKTIDIEEGMASINIELKEGVITVRHGTADDVLLTTVAPKGSWDSIFKTLNDIAKSK